MQREDFWLRLTSEWEGPSHVIWLQGVTAEVCESTQLGLSEYFCASTTITLLLLVPLAGADSVDGYTCWYLCTLPSISNVQEILSGWTVYTQAHIWFHVCVSLCVYKAALDSHWGRRWRGQCVCLGTGSAFHIPLWYSVLWPQETRPVEKLSFCCVPALQTFVPSRHLLTSPFPLAPLSPSSVWIHVSLLSVRIHNAWHFPNDGIYHSDA